MAVKFDELLHELSMKILSCELAGGKQLDKWQHDQTVGSYCEINRTYAMAFSFPDEDFDFVAVFGRLDKREADETWQRWKQLLKKEVKELYG